MFSPSSKSGGFTGPGSCFTECGCKCNKACTDMCAKAVVPNPYCLQSCGCPNDANKTQDLLKASDDFFKEPVLNKTDDQLNDEFEAQLNQTFSDMYGPTKYEREEAQKAAKEKEYLHNKLTKIETHWNQYVKDANALGVDPKVFCNETCSHDCFVSADAADSVYDVLTG